MRQRIDAGLPLQVPLRRSTIQGETVISRREFLGTSLGAGALALTPEWLRAIEQSGGRLIQRAIPSTGETIPVIGL